MAGPRSWGRGSATRTSMTAGEGGAVLREGNGSAAGGGRDGGRTAVHSRSRERQRSLAGWLARPSPRGEPSRMDGEAASSMIWPRGPVSVGQTRGRTGQTARGAGDARSASQPRPFLRGPVCAWAPHCRVGRQGHEFHARHMAGTRLLLVPSFFLFFFLFFGLVLFYFEFEKEQSARGFPKELPVEEGVVGGPMVAPPLPGLEDALCPRHLARLRLCPSC